MHVIISESQLDIFRRLTESDTPQLNNGSVKEFGDSSEVTINPTITDADGNPKLTEVFNFGKHKGSPVADVLHIDPGYYSWILAGDFTYNTKQVLTRIRLRESKLNG